MLTTRAAAIKLGCSRAWLQKLAQMGELAAYYYDDSGELIKRTTALPGQTMLFRKQDLEAYTPRSKRRTMGSKDKVENNPKRKKTGGF
jgi:hypothetical protein